MNSCPSNSHDAKAWKRRSLFFKRRAFLPSGFPDGSAGAAAFGLSCGIGWVAVAEAAEKVREGKEKYREGTATKCAALSWRQAKSIGAAKDTSALVGKASGSGFWYSEVRYPPAATAVMPPRRIPARENAISTKPSSRSTKLMSSGKKRQPPPAGHQHRKQSQRAGEIKLERISGRLSQASSTSQDHCTQTRSDLVNANEQMCSLGSGHDATPARRTYVFFSLGFFSWRETDKKKSTLPKRTRNQEGKREKAICKKKKRSILYSLG